ncbi:MAG TPA: hypothetical protein VGC45_04830 [Gryllotalpicola sp.]
MSDPTAWQSPQYGAAPGWTPPPKPGLIPLRPLTFGQLLSTPFQVMRRNIGALFGPAVLIQAITLLATLAIVGAAAGLFAYRVDRATDAGRSAIEAGGVATVILAGLVAVAIGVIGSGFLQGVVVIEVANGTLGHRPRAGQLWRATRGRRWALAGYVALLAAALLLALAVLAGIVAALIVPGLGQSGGGRATLVTLGVVVGVIGGLGFAVLAAWLWTRTSLTAAAIVLERLGVRQGIARSWALTRRGFWRAFGAQALVIGICYVASEIISTPVSLVFSFGMQLAFPTGTPTASDLSDARGVGLAAASYGVLLLLSLVIGSVTGVIEAATPVLVYIDQRMRREGLDLTLTRYAEDVQAGRPVGDPFATPNYAAARP